MPLTKRLASSGSLAALASLVRMPSKNSPAALRVNVNAMIRSGAWPLSSSRMKRLVSWKVFPEPAEARIIVFGIALMLHPPCPAQWLSLSLDQKGSH